MLVKKIIDSSMFNMSSIIRYSWKKVIFKENLAEHVLYVSMLSDIISKDILIRFPRTKIDVWQMLQFAIYHDYEELFTWDMISTVKNRTVKMKKEYDKVSRWMLEEWIDSEFWWKDKIWTHILNQVKNYEKNKFTQLENQIVKFADIFQAYIYSKQEFELWNLKFKEVIETLINTLENNFYEIEYFKCYIDEIKEHFNSINK